MLVVMMNESMDRDWTMSYRKTAHSVYDLKYHMVWVTKYRKAVLRGEIAVRARELIRQTCATLEVYILSGHVSSDHIHLLVSVPPQLAVSELGATAERAQQSAVAGGIWRVETAILGTAHVGTWLFRREHRERDR